MADGEDPPDRLERGQRGLGRPERLPDSTPPAPASRSCCPRRSSTKDVNNIGLIRVDLAAASALKGLLEDLYTGKATIPYDVPVPGGTTDFSQFILGAQNAGAEA